MKRPLLVGYDVSDDAKRARVHRHLDQMADWVQGSTWLLPAAHGLHPDLVMDDLRPLVTDGDRILVVRPCAPCAATFVSLSGPPVAIATPSVWLTEVAS